MQHVKPEGVADGRQQGGNGNGALGWIGDDGKPRGGDGGHQAVQEDGGKKIRTHKLFTPTMSMVAERPMVMQEIIMMEWTPREMPIRMWPCIRSMMELII